MNENGFLINGYCRLVNRTFSFIQKDFDGVVPAGRMDQEILRKTKAVYEKLEPLHEEQDPNTKWAAEAREVLEEYLRFATDYLEQGNPWDNRECDRRVCRNTILNSMQMIANLTIWLETLEEYPADQVKNWLELDQTWQVHQIHSGYELPATEDLIIYNANSSFQMA